MIRARLIERAGLAFAITLLANSILRGIRTPGRWACTELLINYDFGFSKRALQGAILSAFGTPALYQYNFCFWYQLAILAVNVALLIDVLRRLCATGGAVSRYVAIVFASSLAVVVLAHTVGYADHIALLVTLIALRIKSFYPRCLFVGIFFPAVVLIHETEFVLFFAVILFRFAIDPESSLSRSRLASVGVAVLLVLITLLGVGSTHMSERTADAMYQSLQAKADYPLRKDEFFMITSTFVDNLKVQLSYLSRPNFVRFFLYSWWVTLPTTLWIVRRTVVAISDGGHGRLIIWLAVAASLAPLSMQVIGGDANRWTTLATTTSFIVYATVRLYLSPRPSRERSSSGATSWVPVGLVAMNLGSSIPLFDGYVVQSFPYEEHLYDVAQMLDGNAPFPPRPEQCVESGCMAVFPTLRPPQSGTAVKP